MANTRHMPGSVFVINKDNMQRVYNADGNEISMTIFTRVTDVVDQIPTVLIKAECNLVADEKEMMEVIKSFSE